jgi:dipeptidase D
MNPTELILEKFEQISSIPRGTKFEAGIRQWLIGWGAARSLKSRTDAAGNLVICVPASIGYENYPTLILQGHMDMVWQKTPESKHNFEQDPIELIRDGDWIKANGTTLGADNGIGMALMLALVEDESVQHPPLELLFTVEEEMGVVGADNLDPALLSGKTLINVDSETEGVFTVGCAGGGTVIITLPVSWSEKSADEVALEIKVGGLQGGHSGEDINKFRGNANKILARILDVIQQETQIRLSALKGGTARNAIPREAAAAILCPQEKLDEVRTSFGVVLEALRGEFQVNEQGLSIALNPLDGQDIRAVHPDETKRMIEMLIALPHGVSSMSADMPIFVETSNNIGMVELAEGGCVIVSNHRSSVPSRLEEITRRVEIIAKLSGAKTERTTMFPPWKPNMDSALLKKCVETYREVAGAEPKIELTHGGLECGIISDRCGGLDTISMGPTIRDLHSPDERLFIPSLIKVWEFIKTLLADETGKYPSEE